MNRQCSEDQQLEAGGRRPHSKGEAPPLGQGRPGAAVGKGSVGVRVMLLESPL